MPIDHYENNPVREAFIKIFSWAEAIERTWCTNGESFDIMQASYDVKPIYDPSESRVHAVPESVAAMASYLTSLRRRSGIHAVIDLGAGTTDVSICNLHINMGESKSYWYAARNIPKGTINVERVIASHLNECSMCTCQDMSEFLCSLSEDGASISAMKYPEKLNSSMYEEIRKIKTDQEYYRTWGSAYKFHFRKETAWNDVEIFLSGGGANFPYVQDIFSIPWWNKIQARYRTSILPTPDNYDPGKCRAPFERMSVAYGLSYPIPQFEDYTLPGDCKDQTPPTLPTRVLYHEDLYAR